MEDHQSPRCRYWSTTEVAVEVRVLAPGTPGSRRSARLTVQVTVTETVPTWPTGTLRPPVLMLTDVDAHLMPWSSRDSAAADCAAPWAAAAVRWMDASRAASSAAESIFAPEVTIRPPAIAMHRNMINAGKRIAASIAALPSSLRTLRAQRAMDRT